MRTLVGLVLLATASVVGANETSEETFVPYTYGEIHLGQTNTSLNQGDQDFSYITLGGSYGYQFHQNFGTEFFMSFAINKKTDDITSAFVGTNVKTTFNAFGGYLVGKTTGDFYGKVKLGLIGSQFTYSAGGYEDESSTDVGISYGLGVGIKGQAVGVELNYLVMPEVDDPLWDGASYDSDMLLLNLRFEF